MNVEVIESSKIIKFTEKLFYQLIRYLLTQLVLHMLSMVIKFTNQPLGIDVPWQNVI